MGWWDDIEALRKANTAVNVAAVVIIPLILVGFNTLKQRISERIAVLNSQAQLARESALRADLEVARQRQAKAESSLAQLQLRTAPRHLQQPEKLTSLLRTVLRHPVRILASSLDPEASAFAAELGSAIQRAGWEVDRPTNVMLTNPPSGVALLVRDGERHPEAAAHLQDALRQCGVEAKGGVDPKAENDITLMVGPRP